MTSPITTEGLSKSFGGRRVVDEVSLCVDEGRIFGFLGPNGAGKSTTIRCLLGLYRPSSGRALVLGDDPATGRVGFLRHVGYLPGELHLPEQLTGADVVDRFARMRGLRDVSYLDQLVERFAVTMNRRIGTLSKGNKQKLGIVLAFMHRPRLLVLDEPTSGLDPLLQEEFAALLYETVGDGRTVLLSSHDLAEVQRVVHRVAIIRDGRIMVDDTVEELRARAPRTMELTFDHDVDSSALAEVAGVTVSATNPRRLVVTHTGSAAPVLWEVAKLQPDTITSRAADLDELFRQLFGPTATEVPGA